jgi:outer membrane protein OmpA-like peptidoglycan-associated protein
MKRVGCGLVFLLMFCVMFIGCAAFKPVDLNPRIKSGQIVQKTENFVVLFDKSASMFDLHSKPKFTDNDTRLKYGKDTTKNMIATLPDIRLNAGLRTFWADKTVLIYGMTPLNKEDYTKAINSIEFPNGGTPLEKAIMAADNDLKGAKGNSALIIVSDFSASPIKGDIKNADDINNDAVMRAITKINADYGDSLCVYAIQLGYTLDGKDLSEQIMLNVNGGYNVNSDKLETPQAMATFVERVISGNCEHYQQHVAKPKGKVTILTFEDIHFDFDKSTLTPEAQAILKRDVQKLKENPKAKIRIAGYTSAAGTDLYNQKLSERRATAVQEYLINEGIITPDRLTTIGYGETDPAMYEAAPKEIYSKEAKANMRVLFQIVVE